MVSPTTSYPSLASIAATTDESTPPDIATATRVACGGLEKPRELRVLSLGVVSVRESMPCISRLHALASRRDGNHGERKWLLSICVNILKNIDFSDLLEVMSYCDT